MLLFIVSLFWMQILPFWRSHIIFTIAMDQFSKFQSLIQRNGSSMAKNWFYWILRCPIHCLIILNMFIASYRTVKIADIMLSGTKILKRKNMSYRSNFLMREAMNAILGRFRLPAVAITFIWELSELEKFSLGNCACAEIQFSFGVLVCFKNLTKIWGLCWSFLWF